MPRRGILIIGATFVFAGPAALGQWTVTNLHPAGATESRAHGVSGQQQVGRARINGQTRASLWTGTAESWVDLHPAGAGKSECWDVDRGHQVGYARFADDKSHAALWSGTSDSFIDLDPGTSEYSVAWSVDGDMQAGSAVLETDGKPQAVTWKSTAASVVAHTPQFPLAPQIRQAEFYGIRDGEMVGFWLTQSSSFRFRGIAWDGVQAVDITPPLPPFPSELVSCNVDMTSRGEHVGFAGPSQSENDRQAVLWTGKPLSAIYLSPPGSSSSWAQGIWRGQQVGYAAFPARHAVLWNGTATSCVDLHVFLSSDSSSSVARAIWSDQFHTYAAGWGTNSRTGRTEALMWTRASCWADLTHNEVVDDEDFSPFAFAYDELICPAKLCPADLNDDGVVDDADFQLFVSAYDAPLCP